MKTQVLKSLAYVASALALASAPAANAATCWTPAAISAARIGEFDVMLMTTTLRCRALHATIQESYERFAKAHRKTLDEAYARLKSHHGVSDDKKAQRGAYDRFMIGLANFYGGGETTRSTCLRFAMLADAMGEIADSLDALQSVIFAVIRDPRLDGPRCPALADTTPSPKP